jgi:hypothetical protein
MILRIVRLSWNQYNILPDAGKVCLEKRPEKEYKKKYKALNSP